MGFLSAVALEPQGPILRGGDVLLRYPQLSDFAQWRALREESRSFLTPWEPTWSPDELEKSAFRRRLRRYAQEISGDTGYPFFIFRQSDQILLGGLTMAFIRRGVTQAATLGYWMGAPHAGKGYMTSAVIAAVNHGFGPLQLHRIEAACLPVNEPSIRLLERVGFTREGYARAYLCINDRWQDHLLFGLLSSDRVPLDPRAFTAPAR